MSYNYALYSTFFLLIVCGVHAQGDSCLTAMAIAPGSHTADGPAAGAAASQADATNADWYAFTPAVDAFMTITSCGTTTDTRLLVHTGDCGSLNLVASDDNTCGNGIGSIIANTAVVPGTTWYIEFDDAHSTDGFDWQLFLHGCPVIVPEFESVAGGVTINWEVLAAGAQFTIEYGPPGFEIGTGTVINGIQGDVQPPVNITGLNAGETYEFYISADCGGGNTAPFNGPWYAVAGEEVVVTNDDCEGAIAITCGSITEGSTLNAALDAAPECGTSVSAAGVWYSFTGVDGFVSLSTCANHGYDTKLNVYTGACDDLQCVVGNDDGPFGCFPGSELYLETDVSTTYYVLVQGYDGEVGDFGLAMGCPECAPPTQIYATPSDELALLYWTSQEPGGTFTVEYGPDGFAPGTGTVITGTVGTDGPPVTMTGLDPLTDYDAYVTETCVGGTSDMRGPVSFTTLEYPLAPNAFCNSAIPIACGEGVTGNTTLGIYAPVPECGSAYADTPGLWYRLIGTGNDVTVSTCDQADFDTKISVFLGPCAALDCVGGVDDATGCGGNTSRVTFAAAIGVEYFILVHGYDGAVGEFTLSMTCADACTPAVPNDECATATTLTPQPVGACLPLTGTNTCAYTPAIPNPACDPYSEAHDVWYSLNTGPSADHTVTVASISAGELGVALYSACDPPAFIDCFDPQAGPIELSGLDLNTTYFIQVWNGGGAEAGSFTICDEAPIIDAIGENSASLPLRAWPIPADDLLTVEGIVAASRLILVDAQGRTVFTSSAARSGQQVIDISALAPGPYVLKVEGEGLRSLPVILR